MSSSTLFARKFAVWLCGAAAVAGALAGCGTTDKPQPSPTSSSSAPASTPPSPTQKNLNPTGGNSFTPGDKAPPPQTAAPGRHKY